MLARLRRAFGGGPVEDGFPVPDRLGAFDRETPHRFRTWLLDPGDRDRVATALAEAGLAEVSAEPVEEPDGRVRLDVTTAAGLRTRRILEPLDALRRAAIGVSGFEPLDVVAKVGDEELRRTVAAAALEPIDGTHHRRLDALAGETLVRRCIAEWARPATAPRRPPEATAWRLAAASAAYHTPAGESLLLRQAAATRLASDAAGYIHGALHRVRLCTRAGVPVEIDEDLLLRLVGRGGEAGEAAIELVAELPFPLAATVVEALCSVVDRRRSGAVRALIALRRVPASPRVVAVVESALDADDPDVPDVALQTLAALVGTVARPAWERFLASRSAYRRLTAEVVLGEHGDADDVPVAAATLEKLLRTKPATETVPPRASNLIALLVRHRDLPQARDALADLTARWARLPPDLRSWILAHEPWLAPRDATPDPDGATSAELPDEPTLVWPAPRVERRGSDLHLEFAEVDHTVRDRFGDLIAADPRVTVVDGDREWLTLRIDDPDPEALIAAMWAAAHAPPS